MAIVRCLDISTCALTQRDVELLDGAGRAGKDNPLFCYPYEHGAFISGPDFSERDPQELDTRARDIREFGYSDSVLKLLAYCRDHDIGLIRLDSDGDDDLCDGTTLDNHDW